MRKCQEKFSEEPKYNRFYSHIGQTSKDKMVELMKQVDEFVAKNLESDQPEKLELEVESYALRRQLGREIYAKYNNLGKIFSENKRGSNTFTVKKVVKDKKEADNKGKELSDDKVGANPEDKTEVKIPEDSSQPSANLS